MRCVFFAASFCCVVNISRVLVCFYLFGTCFWCILVGFGFRACFLPVFTCLMFPLFNMCLGSFFPCSFVSMFPRVISPVFSGVGPLCDIWRVLTCFLPYLSCLLGNSDPRTKNIRVFGLRRGAKNKFTD